MLKDTVGAWDASSLNAACHGDAGRSEGQKVMSNPASEQTRPLASSFDLTGKRVVVVGGKKAIGLGIAQAAHAMGAAVTVASRRNLSGEEQPDLAAFDQVVLDIRDEAAVQAAFEAVGPFDHLVVTAGPELGSWGSFMDPDMRGVRSYLEGKFLGSWACARHAAPRLLAGGSITLLSGGTGARAKLGLAAVTSTFAAVESLSQSLALELAPIRVNTIRPGFIDTDFWDVLPATAVEEIRAKVRANFPARRLGTAADVGHAAVFLMTNPYVTGTVLEVSGGELLVDWIF
ncbi:MAG: SDR family oxidoreductase [Hansschlegelia sp.]